MCQNCFYGGFLFLLTCFNLYSKNGFALFYLTWTFDLTLLNFVCACENVKVALLLVSLLQRQEVANTTNTGQKHEFIHLFSL